MRASLVFLLFFYSTFACSVNDPRWYSVELIVFTHTDDSHLQSESWPATTGMPDYSLTKNTLGIETLRAQSYELLPYDIIPEDEQILLEQRDLIDESRKYRLLFHRAWRQTMQINGEMETMYIEAPDGHSTAKTGETPLLETYINETARLPELEGTLRITIGRYLHVYTDFIFRKNIQVPISTNPFRAVLSNESELGYTNQIQSYRVASHRRMRSRRFHYIDHPAIGILIQFTPFDANDPAAEENEAANPLADLIKEKAQDQQNDNNAEQTDEFQEAIDGIKSDETPEESPINLEETPSLEPNTPDEVIDTANETALPETNDENELTIPVEIEPKTAPAIEQPQQEETLQNEDKNTEPTDAVLDEIFGDDKIDLDSIPFSGETEEKTD
jgi:hypothetical protein